MWKELHKKLGNESLFIAINAGVNENIEDVKKYAGAKKILFPVVYDVGRKIGRAFRVVGIPFYIVIDRKGLIRYQGSDLPDNLEKLMEDASR